MELPKYDNHASYCLEIELRLTRLAILITGLRKTVEQDKSINMYNFALILKELKVDVSQVHSLLDNTLLLVQSKLPIRDNGNGKTMVNCDIQVNEK